MSRAGIYSRTVDALRSRNWRSFGKLPRAAKIAATEVGFDEIRHGSHLDEIRERFLSAYDAIELEITIRAARRDLRRYA